jgi:hypothetical protein
MSDRPTLDAFGELLTIKDLAAWRGVSPKRMYAIVSEGTFDFARPKPPIGRLLFSRALLKAWADGTPMTLTGIRRTA